MRRAVMDILRIVPPRETVAAWLLVIAATYVLAATESPALTIALVLGVLGATAGVAYARELSARRALEVKVQILEARCRAQAAEARGRRSEP